MLYFNYGINYPLFIDRNTMCMKKNSPVKKYSRVIAAICGVICLCAWVVSAETMLNIKMGPAWPKELRTDNTDGGITAWEPSIEIGGLFNRIVGIGFDAEFQWKRRLVDSTYEIGGMRYQVIDKVERFFLFPPSFYLCIDPIPDLVVHPVIKGQVGMTLLYYSNTWFEDNDGDGTKDSEQKSDDSGLYYGVLGKAGVDALYDLGENVSIFAGFEFQFGNARRRVEGQNNQYYRKQIFGPGIRMGFRFLM